MRTICKTGANAITSPQADATDEMVQSATSGLLRTHDKNVRSARTHATGMHRSAREGVAYATLIDPERQRWVNSGGSGHLGSSGLDDVQGGRDRYHDPDPTLQSAILQTIGQFLPLYWLGLGMRSALLPDEIAQIEIDGSWRTIETGLALGAWAVVATLLALYAARRMTHRTSGSRASLLRRRRARIRPARKPRNAGSTRLIPSRTAPTGKIGTDG